MSHAFYAIDIMGLRKLEFRQRIPRYSYELLDEQLTKNRILTLDNLQICMAIDIKDSLIDNTVYDSKTSIKNPLEW